MVEERIRQSHSSQICVNIIADFSAEATSGPLRILRSFRLLTHYTQHHLLSDFMTSWIAMLRKAQPAAQPTAGSVVHILFQNRSRQMYASCGDKSRHCPPVLSSIGCCKWARTAIQAPSHCLLHSCHPAAQNRLTACNAKHPCKTPAKRTGLDQDTGCKEFERLKGTHFSFRLGRPIPRGTPHRGGQRSGEKQIKEF